MARKPKRKNLIKKLDAVFSKYIRLRDADQEGYCRCATCGVACNVFKYGEQYKYSLYLGDNLSKELYNKSLGVAKFTDIEIIEMIEEYNEKSKDFSFHT